MKRIGTAILALVLISACEPSATDLVEAMPPSLIIVDGVHSGGNEHFLWLPPMVPDPSAIGIFDSSAAPEVKICELDTAINQCLLPLMATYTMTTGPGSETVRVNTVDEYYHVNWHTDEFGLDDSGTYRIIVSAEGQELGLADVDVVNGGRELKNVDTDSFIALKDGRTLPIKFRIEQGALGPPGPSSCAEILATDPFGGNGIYTIEVLGDALQVYCDMTTDGGGWTLVLLNSPYPNHPKPTFAEAVNNNNVTGTMGSLMDFDQFLGTRYWNSIGSWLRVETGALPTSLSHRAVYEFSLDAGSNYAIQLSNEQIPLGSTSPGLFVVHNGLQLSTLDADNDTHAGSCATLYSDAAWWYEDCWSGSFWGGGSSNGGFENAPYWSGTGSEFFPWGAFWIR